MVQLRSFRPEPSRRWSNAGHVELNSTTAAHDDDDDDDDDDGRQQLLSKEGQIGGDRGNKSREEGSECELGQQWGSWTSTWC